MSGDARIDRAPDRTTDRHADRPLSVAFVLSGLGVVRRGAEALIGDLARTLPDRGFEVTLFGRADPALADPSLADPRVRFRKVRALPRDTRWLDRLYRGSRLGRKALDTVFLDPLSIEWATSSLSALPALLRGRFDVVVMEGGLVGGWVARWVRRRRGAAFVDIAHGVDPKWEGAFARQRPDRTVVFTRAAAAMLGELAPDAALEVIPHGIDLEQFHPRVPAVELGLPRPVVLAVGAVDAYKRFHLVVEALAALRSREGRAPEAAGPSLLVLGDGPEAEALDRLASRRLPHDAYRRRTVARDELPGFYAAADVVTLPSVSESFGLVYVEAMACRTPVVAPDDPVRHEVVGDGGLFAEVTDATLYGRALDAALTRAAQGGWGDAPRRQAERFPFEPMVDAYERLFRELVPERR